MVAGLDRGAEPTTAYARWKTARWRTRTPLRAPPAAASNALSSSGEDTEPQSLLTNGSTKFALEMTIGLSYVLFLSDIPDGTLRQRFRSIKKMSQCFR